MSGAATADKLTRSRRENKSFAWLVMSIQPYSYYVMGREGFSHSSRGGKRNGTRRPGNSFRKHGPGEPHQKLTQEALGWAGLGH